MRRLADKIGDQTGCVVRITVAPRSKKYQMVLETWGSEAFEGLVERFHVEEE